MAKFVNRWLTVLEVSGSNLSTFLKPIRLARETGAVDETKISSHVSVFKD
jgi:hypothetical protein